MQDPLSTVRVHVAGIRDLNRDARTYNLPNETLSAIFEAGLIENPFLEDMIRIPRMCTFEYRAWGSESPPFEILVSSVSRRWRSVALQTPRLWTVLNIDVENPTHDHHDLYLHRSKTCSLDITLSNCYQQEELPSDLVSEANPDLKGHMYRLMPHVGRWRKFIILNSWIESPSTVFSALAHSRAPALETLVLDFRGSKGPILDLFSGGAPRLSCVELVGLYLQPPLEVVKYAKLHHPTRSETQLTYAEMNQLIRPMHSLIHLQLDSDIVAESANYPLIELPSLLSLDIRIRGSVGALRFLDLPAIKILTIYGFSPEIIQALTQHHCLYPRVQVLKFVADIHCLDNTPGDTVVDLILLFPNVVDITFRGTDPIPILKALHNRRPTDKLLWPHLSAITISIAVRSNVGHRRQIWFGVVKVVGNYLELGKPLPSIKLSSKIVNDVSPRLQQRLREQVAFVEF